MLSKPKVKEAAKETTEAKTPYQGQRQTFGQFKCQKCNRFWTSNNSWANYGQMCTKCSLNIYPFRQVPLEKSEKLDKSDPNKHHPKELCEKCRAIGHFCGQGKKIGRRRRSSATPQNS